MINLYKGDDAVSRKKALNKDVEKFLGTLISDPFSKEVIQCQDTSSETPALDRFFQSGSGNSMFADKKAIILKGVESLGVNQLKELSNFLKTASETNGYFFEGAKVDARSEFSKTIKKMGEIKDFKAPRDYELPKWAMGRARDFQFKMHESVAKHLIELTGPDIPRIDNEFEKLRNFAPDSSEISIDMIREVVVSNNEGNIFDLINAFGHRNALDFVKNFRLIENASKPGAQLGSSMIVQFMNHVQTLIITNGLLKEGVAPNQIAKEMKIHEYVFTKINNVPAQSAKRPLALLERILVRLSEIDAQLKDGTIRNNLQFETALVAML